MGEFRFVEKTKIICDRTSHFTLMDNSYEEALNTLIREINNTTTRDVPNKGNIEITNCFYSEEYEVVSEEVKTSYGELIYYEKRKDI